MAARIALVIDSFRGGGAQRMMVNLANHWVGEGYPVDFLVVTDEGPFRDLLDSNVRLRVLGARSALLSIHSIARYLRHSQPRVILSALTNVNIATIVASKLAGKNVRVVVSERNSFSSVARYSKNYRNRFLLPPLARITYPLADRIVGISKGVSEDLSAVLGIPADRITPIYNPVVVPGMSVPATSPNHCWYCGPRESPVLIASGRLVAQKDYVTLLRSMALLEDTGARLMVLGEGPERPHLESLVREMGLSERVSFVGFVADPLAYMGHADVFVMSSAWEGFGNVLVEALYCGLPIVSTDCPSGPAEILCNEGYGRLVPVGDAEALAAAIQQAILDPGDAKPRRKRANEFRVDVIAAKYMAVMMPGSTI